MKTQRDRVLDALRKAGDRGVCSVEFLAPHVIDGGPPITRLAARVGELREEGYRIVHAGTRQKCVVYALKESPVGVVASDEPVRVRPRLGGPVDGAVGQPVAGSSEALALFDPASVSRPLGAYDDVEAA